MSKIVIITFGTYGDVAPLVGLGTALRTDGFDVAIASQAPYEALVTGAGLEYRFLPKDTEKATRESALGQEILDGGRMKPSRTALRQMVEQMQGVGPAMAAASEGADLLLASGPVGTLFGYHIAEAMRIPSAAVYLQPLARTREFAPPVLTVRSFGGLGNRALWKLGAQGEKIYLKQINELRTELGLPSARLRDFQATRDARWPALFGFSEHVVPRPRDWHDGLEITGYWWPPETAGCTPSAELTEFLAAGPPPVFVGFGSTATKKGAQLSAIVAEATERAGVRVVLQSGWAGLEHSGDHVLTIGSVPYEWLFPRMSAVVHHAGAGTTAAGLRAGVPAIPVPGIMDQPYWSTRLVALGVAAGYRPRRELTADWLSGAISTTIGDPRYRQRAQEVSAALAAEDGCGTAVASVRKLLAAGVVTAR